MKKHLISILIGLVVVVGVIFISNNGIAHANPGFFGIQVSTAVATSTLKQIIPGTATSTLVFDSYGSGQQYVPDSLALLLQATASSTSSTVQVAFQFSQDGIDWYTNNPFLGTATTTQYINNPFIYQFTAVSTATNTDMLSTPVPTRYVRAVISAVGANSQIWATFVPKKQISSY